jgi:hypothetical protein
VNVPGTPRIHRLVNSNGGGVEGYKIRAIEIDSEFKVPLAIEAYERQKKLRCCIDHPLRQAVAVVRFPSGEPGQKRPDTESKKPRVSGLV